MRLIRPLALFALLCLTACAGWAPLNNPVPIAAADYDAVYQSSKRAILDLGFALDRQDYRFGRVTSKPLAAPSIGEVWFPSNADAATAWENTLNTQRRIAQVWIEPATDPQNNTADLYTLRVEVQLERRQSPARRLNGSTRPNGMFNVLTSNPAEYQRAGIAGSFWHPVGRDNALEQKLLQRIAKLASLDVKRDGEPSS